MLRLFVGIDLPPELKLRLSQLCGGIPNAKWVDAGNFHVTLRFIGEVDEGLASDLDERLQGIRAERFDLGLAGVGHFGGKPHMLWVGVERNPALMSLRDKVEQAAVRAGLEPDQRRYTPHVTLARIKVPPPPGKLQAFLSEHALFRAPPFPVAQFSLIASYLTKSGAIYEEQADYRLR